MRPCLVRDARILALPASVLGPVDGPPCIRHRPLGMAAPLQGVPDRVRAPQRGALPGFPGGLPFLSQPRPGSRSAWALAAIFTWPPTGKPVKMRAVVVGHFKGDDLWGETIFFDNASILKQIGAQDRYSAALRLHEAGHVHARQHAAHWSRNGIRVNPCLDATKYDRLWGES